MSKYMLGAESEHDSLWGVSRLFFSDHKCSQVINRFGLWVFLSLCGLLGWLNMDRGCYLEKVAALKGWLVFRLLATLLWEHTYQLNHVFFYFHDLNRVALNFKP